ncbi:MAG: RraA family protein [Pseudomonadota bacterium]
MTLGFRIRTAFDRLPEAVLAKARGLPVAAISDGMWRLTGSDTGLRQLHAGDPLCGSALTVRTRAGDNLMLHKAIDMAQPGDVILVDGGGHLQNALIGEIMITQAQKRGVAGIVIDGAVRDLDFIRRSPFPVFARGVTHRGPYKSGPGEINFPIALLGMVVMPGDLVVGDADGIACIPRAEADGVLDAAHRKVKTEQGQLEAIERGTTDRSWVDEDLRRLGCTWE